MAVNYIPDHNHTYSRQWWDAVAGIDLHMPRLKRMIAKQDKWGVHYSLSAMCGYLQNIERIKDRYEESNNPLIADKLKPFLDAEIDVELIQNLMENLLLPGYIDWQAFELEFNKFRIQFNRIKKLPKFS